MLKAKILALSTGFLLAGSFAVTGFGNISGVRALNNAVMPVNIAAAPPQGGSYYQVRSSNTGGEVHHMPAFKAFTGECGLSHGKGPSIWMTVDDHRGTESWGSGAKAIIYRNDQKQLIKQGKFKAAMDKDIAGIKLKFGSKYDVAIAQALTYYQTIDAQGLTAPNVTTPDTTTPDVDTP